MIDPLSALSLYRQLEGLDKVLGDMKGDFVNEFMSAYTNQGSFNHILEQMREQCSDAQEYFRSFQHIAKVNIPKGADRSAYPRFVAQVQMLKQALHAILELALTSDQKQRIGFI